MRRFGKANVREAVAGYLFIMPNFVGFLTFTSLPVLASLYLSFHRWDVLTPMKFAGLRNVVQMVGFRRGLVDMPVPGRPGVTRQVPKIVARDPAFWKYLYNTLFMMGSIPVNIMASLGLAMLLNQRLRGVVFFRALFFLPSQQFF